MGDQICLDPKDVNKAIKREHHPIPTLEEITPKLMGANLFSKLDARNGYWNVRANPQKESYTSVSTPSKNAVASTALCLHHQISPWKTDGHSRHPVTPLTNG